MDADAKARAKQRLTRWLRGWLLKSIMLAAVVALTAWFAIPHLGSRDDPGCFAKQGTAATAAGWSYYDDDGTPHQRPASPLQLSLTPDQVTALPFGRSESVRALDVDYRPAVLATSKANTPATPPKTKSLQDVVGTQPLQVDVSQFRRDDGASLTKSLVRARAKVVGDDRVRVSLCVDRRSAEALADPGTYRGTVSIIDARVARTDIPLEVSGADPRWTMPLFLLLLAVIAGTWVTWVIKEKKPDSSPFVLSEWLVWSGTAIGIICIVAGAVACVGAVQATYLSQGTWGTSIGDYFALLTGCFVAFMGVTTSLHVAGLAQQTSRVKAEEKAAAKAAADQEDHHEEAPVDHPVDHGGGN